MAPRPPNRPLKGMVLAAGLGTRMRPLTELYPKPLVPFAGADALSLALWRLKVLGVQDVAVNSHYHAEQIAKAVATSPLGLRLHLSHEPEVLGTGGAYNPLRAWLGDADLVVINGDIVSDFDLQLMVDHHRRIGAIATMALLPSVIPNESGVHHADGRVLAFSRGAPEPGRKASNFACIQILTAEFLAFLPTFGVFDIISKGYQVALNQGKPVGGLVYDGFWHDLRTPQFYWQALRALLREPQAMERSGVRAIRELRGLVSTLKAQVLSDASVVVGRQVATAGTVILEPGAQIGSGASLADCLILGDTVVPEGAQINRAILGPGGFRIALEG